MGQATHGRLRWKGLVALSLACLPGLLGSAATVRLWLSIIPGNPKGSEIMPFVEPMQELFIRGATLLIGIPLAFILAAVIKRKSVRTVGAACSFLPFPVGFVAFNVIVTVMNYTLI
jgi:hypothetical protein